MKVISADFVTSAALRPLDRRRTAPDGEGLARRGPPEGMVGVPNDGLPQIAMAGRSNVGKSTLINALGRRKVARTSAAPGKTRLANIYRLTVERGPGTWGLYLVDLPGYGYARGGTDSAAELQAVAEAYFAERGSRIASRGGARGALLLVDSRHPGLASDIQAAGWLASMGVEHRIVATKVDKLSRAERAHHLEALELSFGMPPLAVSATSGEGLDALWKTIVSLASTGPE